MLEVVFGVPHILLSPPLQALALFFAESFHDFCGRTEDEGAVGDLGAAGDKRVGSDDALVADLRAIEDDGTHADQAFVADGAGMDNG